MCRYLFQWPIDTYAKIWEPYHRRKMIRKMVTKKTKTIATKTQSHKSRRRKTGKAIFGGAHVREGLPVVTPDKAATRRPWTIFFVGKPPPRVKSSAVRAVSEEGTLFNAPQPGQYSPVTPSATTVAPLSSQHPSPNLRLPEPPQTPVVRLPTEPPTISISNHYPSPCAFCGYVPRIPREVQVELYSMFSAIPHVVPILAMNGLIHGRHLAMLLTWDKGDRQEFCNRLPSNYFSAPDMAMVTDLLVNYEPQELSDSTGAAETQSHFIMDGECESVPWPDDTTKALLMNSANILSDLEHAMGLGSDNPLFTRIIVSSGGLMQRPC